ncbi:MAG: SDR family oxidoreductase [Chitinispirillaceae bacterium]|nr:SDR family oxidoreductase [Chitinispirillaceae bacterium]
MEQFSGKTVIVTGGSRGIGRAIVAAFAAEGACVYFTYHRHKEAADTTAAETGARPVLCEQSDEPAIVAVVDDITAASGAVDILVNNAGIVADQFLMMMPRETWSKVIDTNCGGAFLWTKAVSRCMLNAKRGAIVNIASVSGMVGTAGQANYAASKGAIIAFSRSCAAEFGPKGIRVNSVVPGFIDTDMTARMPRSIKRQSLERILLRRFGTAAEVAAVVTFIASDKASYIAGQTVVVDGGLTGTVV